MSPDMVFSLVNAMQNHTARRPFGETDYVAAPVQLPRSTDGRAQSLDVATGGSDVAVPGNGAHAGISHGLFKYRLGIWMKLKA